MLLYTLKNHIHAILLFQSTGLFKKKPQPYIPEKKNNKKISKAETSQKTTVENWTYYLWKNKFLQLKYIVEIRQEKCSHQERHESNEIIWKGLLFLCAICERIAVMILITQGWSFWQRHHKNFDNLNFLFLQWQESVYASLFCPIISLSS